LKYRSTYRTQVNEVSVFILTFWNTRKNPRTSCSLARVENGSNERHSILNHYSEVRLWALPPMTSIKLSINAARY